MPGTDPQRGERAASRPLLQMLEDIAHGRDATASGSAAAMTAATAAALISMAARASRASWADAGGAIAQAESLRSRLQAHIATDADAYQQARSLLAQSGKDRDHRGAPRAPGAPAATPDERERALTSALIHAAQEPLLIAEAAAEVAEVAVWTVGDGCADHRADAVGAVLLAAAACRTAAHLVEINLGLPAGHAFRARAAAATAAVAAHEATVLASAL
ncbi:hypothetical protein DSM112329_01863 [Paraconexibacter sp. AEG42_29]|uniref:Cyclodeaminase/cyclohydrolase domain-containing protein n=1 Tax=Paraconexibacter sp. AEG42_29 TaxID=2997339 RepID=A0AAU7AU70_9ACTN